MAPRLDEALAPAQHRLDLEQAEPGGLSRRPLDPGRVGDAAAQHLVAAAEAHHPAAAPHVRGDVERPALPVQRFQIGTGGLAARQQHQVGVTRQRPTRRHEVEHDIGLGPERVEVVAVGDARQAGDDNLDGGAGRRRRRGRRGIEADAVFGRQEPRALEPGNEAERGPARLLLDDRIGAVEEGGIAAELVDEEAPGERAFRRGQQRRGADQARDHAAPVHIPHQRHRHARGERKAHVGDIVLPQVHFGRAARALHQDQVGVPPKALETLQHAGHEVRLERVVAACVGAAGDGALHHHLGAVLAFGLEQHRVHVRAGLDAGGTRLQRLGAADLAAVRRDGCVVRHVLRLEGAHPEAARGIGAAEPGHQQGFPHIGAGALEHQGRRPLPGSARHQNSIPTCAFTPARKGCLISVISVTRSAISISAGLALRPVTTTCWSGWRAARPASTASRSR